jgi:hypothetical protein
MGSSRERGGGRYVYNVCTYITSGIPTKVASYEAAKICGFGISLKKRRFVR